MRYPQLNLIPSIKVSKNQVESDVIFESEREVTYDQKFQNQWHQSHENT